MATDGKFLYVVTNPMATSGAITGYSIDKTSGSLTTVARSPFSAGQAPRSVALSPDGKYLYAADSLANTLYGFSVDRSTGNLSALSSTAYTGSYPLALAMSGDGRTLYVANAGESSISVMHVSPSGLASETGRVFLKGSYPAALVLSPDGKYLVALNAGSGDVSLLSISATSLSEVPASPVPAGSQLFNAAFTPDGRYLYVAGNGVYGFGLDEANQILSPLPGFPTIGSGPLAIVPDGPYLYIETGTANVSAFKVDLANGALSQLATYATPENIALAVATTFTAPKAGFLQFPIYTPDGSAPVDPSLAPIVSVMDHSPHPAYYCHSAYCDGVVLAFDGTKALLTYGVCGGNGYAVSPSAPPVTLQGATYKGTSACGAGYLNYDGHSGYDYKYPEGVYVHAAADGYLSIPATDPVTIPKGDATPQSKFNEVEIVHDNGMETWYLHMEPGSECMAFSPDRQTICSANDPNRALWEASPVRVVAGQIIGRVGHTGLPTSAAHLHFEPRSSPSQPVDPYGCVPSVALVDPNACKGGLWQ